MTFRKTTSGFAIFITTSIIIASSITAASASGTAETGVLDAAVVTSISQESVDAKVGLEVGDSAGTTGDVEVSLVSGTPESIEVEAVEADGSRTSDTFTVISYRAIDSDHFEATLYSEKEAKNFTVDTSKAEQQVLPVLLVILARIGIQAALKQFSKVALQKAVTKYALSLNASKWGHIMAKKHKWPTVGATNKNKVADLMGKALANGKSTKSRTHIEYQWKYKGKTIVVRTSTSGHVSNGWVK